MPIVAAFDDWWIAKPRVLHFTAPPASSSRQRIQRMGMRFAGVLMHRAVPVADILEGYALPDEPTRARVAWRAHGLGEADLVRAAQHFREETSENGPLDTDLLVARFLHMLVRRAGELAFHPDFVMRETIDTPPPTTSAHASSTGRAEVDDRIDTVQPVDVAGNETAYRLSGWADGRLYLHGADGAEWCVSEDQALLSEITLLCARRLNA